jgi:alpha-L-fucosidase
LASAPVHFHVAHPPAGYARVEAFCTAKDDAVYAILPRRPVDEVVLDDIEGASEVRVTLLEGGRELECSRHGRQLRIRIPDAVPASLPARQAYVLKLAGAR